MSMRRYFICVMLAALLAPTARAADLSLPPVFGDHMVLQRDAAAPVFGKAPAGRTVILEFAGQRKTAVADEHGDWIIRLDAMPASASVRSLQLTCGADRIQIADVLVGEVWVCAGQSNMEFPLAREMHAKEELASASRDGLRLLNMPYAGQSIGRKTFGETDAKLLTPQTYFRGNWQPSSPSSAREFSAVAYFFGKELQDKLGVPVGLINLAVGGSPTEAWVRREALASNERLASLTSGNWLDNAALGVWCRQRGHENLDALLKSGRAVPADALGPNHPFKPAFLWEAGVARLLPFGIRGVIWYQGESNAQEQPRIAQHEQLFSLLVRDWRAQWNQGDFPFYFCQLSGIDSKTYPSQFWPEFRNSQRRLASQLPGVGMAVTSDLGDAHDVHPRNKRDVGHRLSLLALAKTYKAPVECSGPTPRSIDPQANALVVHFDHADGGLRTSDGQAPRGFEISGPTGDFLPAIARIDGSSVVLSTDRLARPARVRYAWQPFPAANLINAAGLPCSTFEERATAP